MTDANRNQARLFVLVVLAFIPTLLLYRFARSNLRAHERNQAEQELVEIARVAAVEYARIIEESRQLLGALAEFPEIRDGVRPACGDRLASVLRHTPQFTTLSLIGSDGYLICGSLTVNDGLYLGDRAYYRLAMLNGAFSIGEYAVGRITGKPTVGVAYPITPADGSSTIVNVLAASVDLSSLASDAEDLNLPEFSTFSVLDADRTLLVRTPAGRDPLGHDTIGAQAPADFLQLAGNAGAPYTTVATDLDGVDRLFAVAPIRRGTNQVAGFIAVGREEAMLLTEIQEVARQELGFLTAALIAVLILAWLFGHYTLVRTVSVADSS